MKKVAIYCRVSTERQEQEKTVQSQLAELKEICKDFQVVGEYIDEGWSGGTLARPELDRLRDDASTGLFDAIYIHSPDRLARKYAYQVLVLEELKKKEIEVVFFNKVVSDNAEDQLLLGVQGLIAEYEKVKILERTRRGRLYKAKKGLVAGSIPPYGYTYIKKTSVKEGYYIINRKEARVVKLIFGLYLERGSVREVARELTNRKIKPRLGKNWRPSTIHRILINESYVGTTYYNKYRAVAGNNEEKEYRKRVNTRRVLRDKNEWIPIQITPLIDKKIFQLVQVLLKKNHKPLSKQTSYLLSGLIKCGTCGSTYSGEKSHNHTFYRCNNRHKTFPLPKECNAKMISADRLDSAVWSAIYEALKQPKILVSHISYLTNNITQNKSSLKREKEELAKGRANIDQKKDRILEAYTERIIDKPEFSKKIENYREQEKELIRKMEGIEQKLNQTINGPLLKKDINRLCVLMKRKLKDAKFEEKQKILKYLIDTITFDSLNAKAKVIGYIPITTDDKKFNFSKWSNPQCGTLSTTS